MKNFLTGPRGFLAGPALFALAALALFVTWLVMEPDALRAAFDSDGLSPFEIATLPFYAAIIPLVWFKCPFTGSPLRRNVLRLAVSCVVFMAVCKQLDLHLVAIKAVFPDVVANFRGTPFKMRFLTSPVVPVPAKLFSLSYFVLFFGVFAATLAYFAVPFIKGVFKLQPVAWSVGCMGASGVMVQIFDRLPAWYRHAANISKDAMGNNAFTSFCTAFEEGGEMMLAAFAILAVCQSWLMFNSPNRDI